MGIKSRAISSRRSVKWTVRNKGAKRSLVRARGSFVDKLVPAVENLWAMCSLPHRRSSWQTARVVQPNLSIALCSITPTQRRRYFWAAWWTGQPSHAPFRKPDAAHGGARTFEEAMLEAQAATGRMLTMIDPYWARAWKSVLRGQNPGLPPTAASKRVPEPARTAAPPGVSAWSVLGLAAGASLAEVKQAFQRRALETHPDHGGKPEDFQAVQRAYEKLRERLAHEANRPRRKP